MTTSKNKYRQNYTELRAEMFKQNISMEDLTRPLNLSRSAIISRFSPTIRRPWRSDEMYKVLDYLQLPYHLLHFYFPPNGGMGVENEPAQKANTGMDGQEQSNTKKFSKRLWDEYLESIKND